MLALVDRRRTETGEERVSERPVHQAVLPRETLEQLAPQPGDVAIDATLGAGGHTAMLLDAVGETGRVLSIDRDPAAVDAAATRFESHGDMFQAVQGDHRELRALATRCGIDAADRILFDLGISTDQLDDPQRGFSFRHDGPLDMRMDPDSPMTAARLVAESSADELGRIIWRFGEERRARAIAAAIVREREKHPIERTSELATLVERVLGAAARRYRIHPATRTFQALRIAVNDELSYLGDVLRDAVDLLRSGGRVAVISFHSLEDRIAKETFRALAHRCVCPPRLPICGCGKQDLVRLVTTRVIRPSTAETDRNPRARSAKLRVAERI